MSMIDNHPLVVGLALFGLAYLNSRVTFPSPPMPALAERRRRLAATAIRSGGRSTHGFAVAPKTP